jgi:hypothetical protein
LSGLNSAIDYHVIEIVVAFRLCTIRVFERYQHFIFGCIVEQHRMPFQLWIYFRIQYVVGTKMDDFVVEARMGNIPAVFKNQETNGGSGVKPPDVYTVPRV